jgi:hypothetical protein
MNGNRKRRDEAPRPKRDESAQRRKRLRKEAGQKPSTRRDPKDPGQTEQRGRPR